MFLPFTSSKTADAVFHGEISLILSQLDYCNSVLVNPAAVTLASLQKVLHAAVRFVANLGFHNSAMASMKALHWLTIADHIKYRLCLMMHPAVSCWRSVYISGTL